MRTRIKICGITRRKDAQAAVEAGCDAIGFVFHAASPRHVQADTARDIQASLPPFVSTVALFMNAEAADVQSVLGSFRPSLLQFHGDEDEAYCLQFGLPYLKAVAMGAGNESAISPDFSVYPSATALLLDGHAPGAMGGSGQAFDWEGLAQRDGRSLVLAGGLNAQNVAMAIGMAHPEAVDVSSGVESSPGIKDPEQLRQFFAAVRTADSTGPI